MAYGFMNKFIYLSASPRDFPIRSAVKHLEGYDGWIAFSLLGRKVYNLGVHFVLRVLVFVSGCFLNREFQVSWIKILFSILQALKSWWILKHKYKETSWICVLKGSTFYNLFGKLLAIWLLNQYRLKRLGFLMTFILLPQNANNLIPNKMFWVLLFLLNVQLH